MRSLRRSSTFLVISLWPGDRSRCLLRATFCIAWSLRRSSAFLVISWWRGSSLVVQTTKLARGMLLRGPIGLSHWWQAIFVLVICLLLQGWVVLAGIATQFPFDQLSSGQVLRCGGDIVGVGLT